MNRLVKIAFFLFAALFFSTSFNIAIASNSLQQQMHSIIQQAQKEFNFNAMSLAVLVPGKSQPQTFVVGTVSKRGLIPISATTLFKVGSVTKTYTSTLANRAIKQNKLSLTDSLKKYLPQYPKWQDITIEELINQTSGIVDYIDTPNWWNNSTAKPPPMAV